MCLLLMGLHAHPRYKLILAANRDEYYDRPTAPAAFREESPGLLAGKDLRGGGTWLGITREGRLAAITNYRDPSSNKADAPSRGELVSGFLLSHEDPQKYLARLAARAHQYNGFNLVAGCNDQYYWHSNRGNGTKLLKPGIYGVCNHLLDTPWPKIRKSQGGFQRGPFSVPEISNRKPSLKYFRTVQPHRMKNLPHTGVGLEWERILGPVFVESDNYGTRSSTVLLIGPQNRVTFIERTFHISPNPHHTDAEFVFQKRRADG